MKKAISSTCKDPENRSHKECVCGGHSWKDDMAKPKRKKKNRESIRFIEVKP